MTQDVETEAQKGEKAGPVIRGAAALAPCFDGEGSQGWAWLGIQMGRVGEKRLQSGGVGREAAGARGLAGVSPVGPDGACSPPGRPPEPHGEVERQALAEPHAGDVHMRWEDTRVWPEEPVGCQDAWGVRRIQRGFGNSGNKSGLSWAKWNNHSPGLHI